MTKRRITEDSIAGRLRKWRRGTGLDLASFAKSMNMALSEYKCYEQKMILAKAEFFSALADRGLDMNWLLTGKTYTPCSSSDSVFKRVSEPPADIKELAANIVCNAFHSEAEAFVASFLQAYGLVLNASDEAALTERACSFFATFGGDGSARDVLWRYLCRRLDERFPWEEIATHE